MKRVVPLSLIGSAMFLCFAGVSQAAVPGITSTAPAATHASVVSQARWWHHRRCWWRHHHRFCR